MGVNFAYQLIKCFPDIQGDFFLKDEKTGGKLFFFVSYDISIENKVINTRRDTLGMHEMNSPKNEKQEQVIRTFRVYLI